MHTNKDIDIDKKFEDHNCKLFRYFDLDETDKSNIAKIEGDEYYKSYSTEELQYVLSRLKAKKCYFE